MEWITIAAIFLGPILAVVASQVIDHLRASRQRKMDVFKTLMRLRRTPMYPEFVGALNLVELEFRKNQAVQEKWRALLDHLSTQHSRHPDEMIVDSDTPDARLAKETAFGKRLFDARHVLSAELLHSIAKVVGHKSEQLEIFKGGYAPQGWMDVEGQQEDIRSFVHGIATGRYYVPVGVMDIDHLNPHKSKQQEE